MQPIIVTHGLSLGFKNQSIVSNMTLQIQAGEFIGIFGSNGSGKTTFLRAILGLLKPLAGDIKIFNAKPAHGNQRIGYMPQLRSRENTVVRLTGRAMMTAAINSTSYGCLKNSKKNQSDEIEMALTWVGANAFADRPIEQLSGGERQRIYLAQALLGRPPILLLDEPLAGLDPHYQEIFITLLMNIKKKWQTTILFTAHDPNPLLKIMDRALYFANKKIAVGPINEVMTSEKLTTLYETPIEVIHYKGRLIVVGEQIEADQYHG